MTKQEYLDELSKIKKRNRQIKLRQNLRKQKLNMLPKIKLPSTSKIVLLVVILLNLQIIWFVEKAIMTYGDLSALYALIGIPTTLVPTVLGYFIKSKAENTSGGIVYESAMSQLNSQSNVETDEISEDGSVG